MKGDKKRKVQAWAVVTKKGCPVHGYDGPEDRMKALVELAVKHFEWAQNEAVARDRAIDTVPALENQNG